MRTSAVTSNFLKGTPKFSRRSLTAFAVVFAVIGAFFLWRSFALPNKVGTLEAEQMLPLPKGAKVVSLSNASSLHAVQFTTNLSITGPVTIKSPATSASVRVYGNVYGSNCSGRPFISMTIDGKTVVPSTRVTGTWTDYTGNISLATGTHQVKVTGTNLGWDGRCTRLLSADVVNLYGPLPTTPTVTLSASPTTVAAGSPTVLTWATTGADTCTASGAWGGSEPLSSPQQGFTTTSLTTTSTFTLQCTGAGGSATASATVTVNAPPPPPPPTATGSCTYGLSTTDHGTSTGYNGYGAGSFPDANWCPYAASSPFNMAASSPVYVSQSASIISNVLASGIGNLYTAEDPVHDYSHPIYYALPTDPLLTIVSGATNGLKIHVPANAQVAGGADGHIGIVQPDGWEYDFWQASRTSTTISGSGASRQRYDGLGIVTKAMIQADPTIGGQTAPYFGLHAGVIRGPELLAKKINHALFIVISCGSADTSFGNGVQAAGSSGRGGAGSFVYPAFKGDAACSGIRPPMGARFWLDLTDAQIDATTSPAWEKTIAKAMHDYGGYMGDTGGPGFGFEFESGAMYTSIGAPNPFIQVAQNNGIVNSNNGYGYVFKFSTGQNGTIDWKNHLHVITPPSQ